ncbi:hypothetical protein A8924_7387 [Saccharopolyspora erythraea NRRL 2338]|uniref:Uncharacterized protein n=2 Tax=Saccharopolyspora erythraea TaxID=1836 RepID=A4FQ61_SACEN|nr:hypothetical protein A8924_7387 [Saccharopolyspora erythraea NRRL 2338]CAM06186.1 hypothetical protein SACE_7025 [Saccharopolyspora erythraea NRRL 2338]
MHIVGSARSALHQLGLTSAKTLCGKKLRQPEDGAAKNAPLCPECYRRSGWTHDKRRQ